MLNDFQYSNTSVPRERRAARLLGPGLLLAIVMSVVSGCAGKLRPGAPASSPVVLQQPSLSIKRDIDLVRLEGVLASDEEIETVYQRASTIYGQGMIINELERGELVNSASWLGGVLEVADAIAMADVGDFSLTADEGRLVIGGEVESEATALAIEDMANRVADQQLVVSNALMVSDAEAPVLADSTDGAPADSDPTLEDAPLLAAASAVDEGATPTASGASAIILERQAALAESSAPALASATGEPASIAPAEPFFGAAIARNKAVLTSDQDYDGDGIANPDDECDTRAGYPVNVNGCEVLSGHLKNVRFQGKTDQLTDRAMQSLDSLASVLVDNPQVRIAVLSYTSDSGSAWDMRGRARDRARSVVSYLVENGVSKSRLQAYAFGHKDGSGDQILIREID